MKEIFKVAKVDLTCTIPVFFYPKAYETYEEAQEYIELQLQVDRSLSVNNGYSINKYFVTG